MQDWTEELVTGMGVGSGIHFVPILLVLESDGDVFSMMQELRVSMQEHPMRGGPKDEAAYSHLFVRPKGTDLVCSHDRMAKKKAPSTRSATWARRARLW
jgi:hypothetical protein